MAEQFYETLAPAAFALLGLWWVVEPPHSLDPREPDEPSSRRASSAARDLREAPEGRLRLTVEAEQPG